MPLAYHFPQRGTRPTPRVCKRPQRRHSRAGRKALMYLLRLLRLVRISGVAVARATVLSMLAVSPMAALPVSSPAFPSAVAQGIQETGEVGPLAQPDEAAAAP